MKNIKKYGLCLRPNFDEIITYLETDQPRRSLPSREATTLRNSHQLTQLDGDTITDLNDMETRLQKDKLRYILLREQATQAGISIAEASAQTEVNEDPASSSGYNTLSPMASPERFRIDTPIQAHTPLATPFRTLEEAQRAEEMLQDNEAAQTARQQAHVDLAQALPASSNVGNILNSPARRKLTFETPAELKRIVEKHLGGESSTQQFDEMIGRASGSNAPMPQPPTTYDSGKSKTYWKRKNKEYILDQLRLSGFDPPHPDIQQVSKAA